MLGIVRLKKVILTILAAAVLPMAQADVSESDLEEYVGYQILAVKTIVGWRDTTGEKKSGDSFEGCDFGRIIIFEGNVALSCNSFRYHYAYRPKALILAKDGSFVMIINGHIYRMSN